MEKSAMTIGFDLGEEISRIHYNYEDNKEKEETPAEISLRTVEIPTTVSPTFDGLDEEAVKARQQEIADFIFGALAGFEKDHEDGQIAAVTFTAHHVDGTLAGAVRLAADRLGLLGEKVGVIGHRLSFAEYALAQKRDLWTYNVGLFEYDRRGLYYYELEINRNQRPHSVTIAETDLTDFLGSEIEGEIVTEQMSENEEITSGQISENEEIIPGNISENEEIASESTLIPASGTLIPENISAPKTLTPEMKGQLLLEAIDRATEGHTISTFYLTGSHFDLSGSEDSWMKNALNRLGEKKRKIYGGQNLYAQGASIHSQELYGRKPQTDFMILDEDLTSSEIYIQGLHRSSTHRITLFDAGTPWYEHGSEKVIISNKTDHLVICIQSIRQKMGCAVTMPLEDMPERPAGTTKLGVRAVFEGPGICKIKVRDLGFGELFPATDKTWEMSFDLREPQEAVLQADHAVVIETAETACHMPLDLRPEGIRLFTLEELCWYISQNYYNITEDFFDEVMLNWMDAITGGKDLSAAIKNYIVGERPVRDLVRLLLGSVDYLNNAEITAIYNQMSALERQNPVERMRTLADYEYGNGHYMQALKHYFHVIRGLDSKDAPEETEFFKAETYGNTGLTFLKLHDIKQAIYWMEKAVATYADRRLVNNYAMLMLYTKDQAAFDKLLELHIADTRFMEEIKTRFDSWQEKDQPLQEQAEMTMLTQEYCVEYIEKLKKNYQL